MTNSPQMPARASRPPAPALQSEAPPAAVSYVLDGAGISIVNSRAVPVNYSRPVLPGNQVQPSRQPR